MPRPKTSIRKAAILVASLDRPTAEKLLRQLPREQALLVAQAATELHAIDPVEQEAVIEEFFRIGPMPAPPSLKPRAPLPMQREAAPRLNDPQLPGIELDGSLPERLASPRRHPTTRSQPSEAPSGPPSFRCLEQADSRTLVPHLEKEHPQTIAVVISHLTHDKAAQVLTALPAALQSEVLQRLTDLDEMDPESLQEIERQLETWITRQERHTQARQAGLHAVARILQAADPHARQTLMANLRRRNGHLADRLASSRTAPAAPLVSSAFDAQRPTSPEREEHSAAPRLSISFAALAQLDDAALAAVLQAAEPELIVLALVGIDPQLLARFMRQLPAHEQLALRRDLQQLGPTRLSDVEAAQQELALVAQELIADGQIALGPAQMSMAA